ncbi:potassium transporter TrkA [Thermus scotoductus]|uniref:Potassium transporter TrkA n=1 Tax=Thermus scotoductus TaxID=37636 RepID=A0A430S5F4_THESC|nr:TrkA C-terminal domain-containing protein [Thermus scotoductus]RTG92220.1 potassium transporter TrkA [Thermus scotoductus]RTH06163.1 potassium transporter TrkA [Thermus scotoductus]RTH08216.1 potassium transporter TrkA [Thermus scotoductus]RTH09216.1 potassium transporter TrkA [Thermus scotoductus]RTH15250.1 potassium transporter TrkA [Thermus scotoductus]
MKVEEVVLPGVGRKFTITVQSGDRLVIVVHHSGKRELQYFEAGEEDEPSATLDLTDEEARELGAILAGVLFHPEAVGDTQSKLGAKVIEWIKVLPGSKLAGRKVREIPLPPGAHLLAVDRPGAPLIPNPGPEVVLEVGDTLVVAGSREAVEALKRSL